MVLVPALFVVDTMLARGRGWEPQGLVESTVSWLSLAALAVALLLVSLQRSSRWVARNWPKAFVLVLAFAVFWIVPEVALAGPPIYFWPKARTVVLQPDAAILPGISGESRFSINTRYFRGDEPDRADVLILCIGGSTTECLYLDDSEAWPMLLQHGLNARVRDRGSIWVGNAGKSGMTTIEHLQLVENTQAMAGIQVAVLMIGINDLQFFGLAAGDPAMHNKSTAPLWDANPWVALLHRVKGKAAAGDPRAFIQDLRGEMYAAMRLRRQQAPKTGQLPDLDQAVLQYRERVAAIVEQLAARGVHVVLMGQPTSWAAADPAVESLLWFGWNQDRSVYFQRETMTEAMRRFNEAVAEVARERGVDYVDVQALCGRAELFYDDCHWNEAGARAVAGLLVEALVPRLEEWFEPTRR